MDKDLYIKSLEERIQLLAQEKASLSLLNEMFRNFEAAKELDEIINIIISDALSLHGGQNVLLYYNVNMQWHFKDLLGNESIVDINKFPNLLHVLREKEYYEIIHDQIPEEKAININLDDTNACDSFYPLKVDNDVVAILVLESRLIHRFVTFGDFSTFFNYAGIVLKNAIQNLTKLERATIEFDQIFQSSLDGILLVNSEEFILKSNQTFNKLFGFTQNEIGKSISSIEKLEDLSVKLKIVQSEKLKNLEFDLLIEQPGDGLDLYCIASISELYDTNKNINGYIVNVKDISDREKIQSELVKITNTFQIAEEISSVGSWDWNFITDEIWWSDGLYRIYGRKTENGPLSTKNDKWLSTIYPDDREKLQTAIKLAIEDTGGYELEYRIIRGNDNRIRMIHTKGQVLKDSNGNSERLIGTAQDITEQRAFEEEIFKKDQLFRLLFQSSGIGVGVYDVEGGIISYNEIALKALGVQESDVVGKKIHDIFPKKEADLYAERMQATIESSDSLRFEDKIDLPTGTKWFLSVYSCIKNLSGKIEGVQILAIDITERKEAQFQSAFLSDSALNLLKISSLQQVYKYTVEKLNEILGERALVLLSEYDNPNNKWKIREVRGINKKLKNIVKGLGFNIETMEGDIETSYFKDIETGRLVELEFDIHTLTNGKISTKISDALKKVLKIERLFVLAFRNSDGEIFGTINIVPFSASKKPNLDFVEAFISQVSIFVEKLIIERDLKENENKLRAAEKIAHLGNYEIDLETGIALWSEETFRIFGLEFNRGKELSQSEYGKLVHPDDNQKLYKLFEECISELKTFNLVYRIIRTDKEIRYVHSIGELEINEKGAPTKMFGTLQDITEQVLSQEKLRKSEERFDLAMNASNDGIFDWNLVSNEIYYSPKWKRILGYEDHELPNDFSIWEKLTEPVDVKRSWEMQQELISRKRDRFVLEFKMKHKAGHWVDILSRAEAVFDEDGNAIRIVGTHQDITDQKRFEEELVKAKNRAEESDMLKSAFLANMSHEIRTPMNGIMGFTNLLQRPGLTGEKQQSYIEIIQKSGVRMLNTVNDIIEISKIETGQVSVVLSEVNVAKQLDFIYDFFKHEIENKGMQFALNNALSTDEFVIKTDEQKLDSILTNLVKNAIKYSNKGTIELSCVRIEGYLKFSVKDMGIGIPENRQKAIFDRFIQSDIEDKHVYEGSGLGLAIVKSYVEMLGGDIWVESIVDKGSTFHCTIAYYPADLSESKNSHDKN